MGTAIKALRYVRAAWLVPGLVLLSLMLSQGACAQGVNLWEEENLAANPDFSLVDEGLPLEWHAVGATGAVDGNRWRQGGVSGRLDRDTPGQGYWEQQVVAWLQPNAPYVVSGWVWGEPGSVAFIGVHISAEADGSPSAGSGSTQLIYRGLAESGWQYISMEFEAPSSGTVYLRLGGDFSGSLWWDEVALRRREELPERLRRDWEARLARYSRVYTGLVVDARGLGLARGMSPRIVDTEGNLLYAGHGADFDWIIRRGIVSYMRDLAQALEHQRLAVHPAYPYRMPLVVRAVGKVNNGLNRDVVVSAYDAQLIRRYLERYDFLARYAVVFLID